MAMTATTASIRSRLEQLPDLPAGVEGWIVEEGVDYRDEPAVWVWGIVSWDGIDSDALHRLQVMARKVVRETTDGHWPYVLVRGVDEVESTS